jgi:hypothetical protein
MSRNELQQSLAALRQEVAALDNNSGALKTRLVALANDIERQLETGIEDASLLAQTRHQLELFEVEHPRLTTILNDIMVTLSNLGI